MLKVQLDSVEGVPVTVTADRPILARLVREVEAAFDTRLEQAHGHVRGARTRPRAVRGELLTNRARLRRLLGEDPEIRVVIACDEGAFAVNACGEITTESAHLPRGITRLDLAEYQVRHGRSYADALPDRIALTSLGYWHWSAGAEHYVAPSVDGKSLASTQDIWRVRRRGPSQPCAPRTISRAVLPELTTSAGRAALDLQVSPSA